MEKNNFLITEFIKQNNENNDIDKLRKALMNKNILSKDYPDENMLLLYNKFENKNKSELENECRSVILNRSTFEIICYTCNTPIYNIQAINYMLANNNIEKEIYKCYEGTLLSLFFYNNKWYISTRRCLDSKDSLWNNKSHYKMFVEILEEDNIEFNNFTDILNKDYSYYFILIHHENKNIVDYTSVFGENYKKLCLAFVRNKDTQEEIILDSINFISKNIFLPERVENIESFDEENKSYKLDEKPNSEGLVIKIKKNNKYKLLKLQNFNYQFHAAMGNKKNIFLGFIYLYQNNKLLNYLNENKNFYKFKKIINPINTNESYDTIGIVDAIFKVFTSELYNLFNILWNTSTNQHENSGLYNILPNEYKNILFGLRGLYFKTKSIKLNNIYNHLKKSINCNEIEKLLRIRKLMINSVKKDNNNDSLKLFSSCSKKCDKVHLKLIAIYTNILFPEIMPDDTI
jgi:hypothetical protein